MLWYQRVHLCLYSALPSLILFILNTLLMRIVFQSRKRLNNYHLNENNRSKSLRTKHLMKKNSFRVIHQHSRKLTISLIFISLSYFILTFPSTVIFSFFRSYIETLTLRRTLSLLFTNLSTTTHTIRFFIYYFCSIDFRNDFYKLFSFKQINRLYE